jgi:gliding motility-associated-like protein
MRIVKIKKILVLLSTTLLINGQNTTKIEDTKAFNKQNAYEEAIKKGIPESDRKGWVEGYLERDFNEKHAQEKEHSPIRTLEERKNLPSYYYGEKEKTTYINLNPPPQTQSVYCPGVGFETLDFVAWQSGLNLTGTISSGYTPSFTAGLSQGATNTIPPGLTATNQQAIMSQAAGNNNPALGPLVGYDGIAINPTTGLAEIPVVAPNGGGVSARLGNDATNYGTERIIYTMLVTPQNAQFTYQYAVVLQSPTGHSAGFQPFFQARIKDQNGVPISGCGQYQVDAFQAATDTAFKLITYSGEDLYYKKWTTVGVDLSAWMSQTLTIEFWTADCSYGGHFGYAYVDATCTILQGSVNGYCAGSSQVTLVAPSGFVGYEWNGPNNLIPIPGGNNDTLILNNPTLNDTFFVQMISAAGCTTFLQTIIVPSVLQIQSITSTPTCPGGNAGTATAIATGGISLGYTYTWSSGAGLTGTIYDTAQIVTGLPLDTVFLHVESGNCPPKDTFVLVTATPVQLQNIASPFCSTTSSQILVAPSGTNYQWYNSLNSLMNGQTNDSLLLNPPINNGNYFTVAYDAPSGCRDSLKITLTQIPGGNSSLSSSPSGLCPGVSTGSAIVQVTGLTNGPYNYVITSGSGGTNSGSSATVPFTISNLSAGTYTVTILDAACVYQQLFTISTYTLNAILTQQNNPCYLDSVATIQISASGVPGANSINVGGPGGFNSTASGATLNLSALNSGQYIITITNSGCIYTNTVTVTEPAMPLDTLKIVTTFCDGDTSAVLGAPLGFTNYQWYYNGIEIQSATNDSLFILNPGSTYLNYSVTYIIVPCERKTIVVFRSVPGTLFSPDLTSNIFSPNNDGKNEYFHPYFNSIISQAYIAYASYGYSMKIYNRWGIQVFESDSYSTQWNGKNSNGKDCDDGTYFWLASYKSRCGDGTWTSQNGFVQLVR